MNNFDRKWRGPTANRIIGFILLAAGSIAFVAGFGAWKNPELDWEIFKQSLVAIWTAIANEFVRFIKDPFAFIGLMVMLVGFLAILNGFKKMFYL